MKTWSGFPDLSKTEVFPGKLVALVLLTHFTHRRLPWSQVHRALH
jgi:hypothetical protein